ncbi:MAG: hypothetical protein KIT89_06025 [Microcella sp.]|uniref:hypothetical protein n=1 Tax=Microcella sp. TaxID=1913979 RepID=UPI0024C879C0|nr:hypothetical protein [Microcella sp.]UYN84718.1 MAG: hypothetical protein KIT89_06025 [Microcella sp.]
MAAAPLTRNQTQSAVIAGAVAHTMFQTGWFAFGMSLAALIAASLFGGLIGAASRTFGGETSAILSGIGTGADILFWVVIAFLLASLILIGLSILVSGWMLSAAGLHRPWRATLAAVGIAALVDIALFWIYLGIANLLTDSPIAGPVLLTPVIALVGGMLIGSLLWWLMALAHRERVPAVAAPDAVLEPQEGAE